MSVVYFKPLQSEDFSRVVVETKKDIVNLIVSDEDKEITKICIEPNLYVFYNFTNVKKTGGISGYIRDCDDDKKFYIGDYVLVRSIDDDTLGDVVDSDLEILQKHIIL